MRPGRGRERGPLLGESACDRDGFEVSRIDSVAESLTSIFVRVLHSRFFVKGTVTGGPNKIRDTPV